MWQCPFFHSQWMLRYYCILNEIILLSPGKCSWGPEQSAVKAMVSSLKGCAVHKGTACAMKEMEALLLEASCSEFLLWGEPGAGTGMAAAQRNCGYLLLGRTAASKSWQLTPLILEWLLIFWSCWHGTDSPSRTAKRGLPMFSLSKFSGWGIAHLALHTHSLLQHVFVMLVFLWMSQGMYSCDQEGGLPADAHTLSESERDKEKGKCTSFTGQWQKWSQPGLVLHCSHSCSWCLNPRMTANKAGTEYRFAHSAAVEAQFFCLQDIHYSCP